MDGFGAQGTVRYAVALDSAQAEQGVTRLRTGLSALTTPTQQVNQQMGILNNNFKATAGGLTKQNTLLAQTATQSKGLGTQVRDMTGRFSTFAIGISATTTSVLALGAGFRDYGDAQIAVDKQTRKLSVAQEAVTKATDKLNTLTKKGVSSGKEYAQAQLDVTQAQQNLEIQTSLLEERQEDMFDAQSRFVASVIPAVVGAVGTMGAAFKDLGLTGGKLKGVFTGIGGTLSGLIQNFTGVGRAAPAAAAGITGVGTASTATTGALVGLKGALIGIVAPLAALAAGAVIGNQLGKSSPEIVKFRDSVDSSAVSAANALGPFGELLKQYREFVIKMFPEFASEAEKASVGLGNLTKEGEKGIKWIAIASAEQNELNNVYAESTRILGPMASMMAEVTLATEKSITPTQQWIKTLVQQKIATNQTIVGLHEFADLHGITIPVALRGDVDAMKKIIAAHQGLGPPVEKSIQDQITIQKLYDQFPGSVGRAATEIDNLTTANTGLASSTASVGTAVKAGTDRLGEYVTTTGDSIIENRVFRDGLIKIATEQFNIANATAMSTAELESEINAIKSNETELNNLIGMTRDYTRALTDQQLNQRLVSQGFRDGVLEVDNFWQGLVKTEQQTKVVNLALRDSIKIWGLDLPRGLAFTNEQLKKFAEAEKLTHTGTLEIEKAIREKLSPSLEQFSGILGATNWKDFKSAWKDLDLKKLDVPKDMRENLRDLGKDMIHINKNALEANTGLHALITTAYFGRTKGQKSTIKAILDDIKEIPGSTQIPKFVAELKTIQDLPKEERSAALIGFGDAIAAFVEATSKTSPLGGIITPGEAENINNFVDAANRGVAPVENFAGSIDDLSASVNELLKLDINKASNYVLAFTSPKGAPTFKNVAVTDQYKKEMEGAQTMPTESTTVAKVDITQATKSITRLIGNFNGWVTLANKANPKAQLDISVATKAITRLAGNFDGWFQLANKANPKAKLDITGATKSITRLIGNFNGWVSRAEKANPKVKLDISTAMSNINKVVSGLAKIKDKTVTVTVKQSGSGTRFAQHGMHESLAQDTLIQAHKGERVDIGPTKGGGQSHSWSGGGGTGGGGNIVIENHMHVMNEDIVRKLTARQGQNRYRFG